MKRILWSILLFLLVFWSGIFVAKNFLKTQDTTIEDSQVLLEQITKVCKLVTVEGHFVEYYDYKQVAAPSSFGYPLFNFKSFLPAEVAQMRIRATVSVGYDLTDLNIEAFPDNKIIRISALPDPEILSIDHEVDYFKDDTWFLNRLEEDDFVRMSKGAEDKVRDAAKSSNLINTAKEQGNEVFELIEFIVTTSGWKLEWEDAANADFPNLPQPSPTPDSAKLWDSVH